MIQRIAAALPHQHIERVITYLRDGKFHYQVLDGPDGANAGGGITRKMDRKTP